LARRTIAAGLLLARSEWIAGREAAKMRATMRPQSSAPGGFRALGLGVRSLNRSPGIWLFAAVGDGLMALCGGALVLAAFAGAARLMVRGASSSAAGDPFSVLGAGLSQALSGKLWLPILGAWLALGALGALLRVVYTAAAVVTAQAALRASDVQAAGVLSAAARVLPRAVAAAVWLWLIELSAGLVRAAFWVSSLLIVGAALARPHGGGGAAAAGALGLTLAIFVGATASLFRRVYLVQAIGHLEVGAVAAAREAARSLLAHLGTYLLLAVLGALLLAGGAMALAGFGAVASAVGVTHPLLGLSARGVASALVAGWAAVVELALVGAVCAVDLGARGELPRPPEPTPPIVIDVPRVAEEVLVAQAIDPVPGT